MWVSLAVLTCLIDRDHKHTIHSHAHTFAGKMRVNFWISWSSGVVKCIHTKKTTTASARKSEAWWKGDEAECWSSQIEWNPAVRTEQIRQQRRAESISRGSAAVVVGSKRYGHWLQGIPISVHLCLSLTCSLPLSLSHAQTIIHFLSHFSSSFPPSVTLTHTHTHYIFICWGCMT